MGKSNKLGIKILNCGLDDWVLAALAVCSMWDGFLRLSEPEPLYKIQMDKLVYPVTCPTKNYQVEKLIYYALTTTFKLLFTLLQRRRTFVLQNAGTP